jgi:AraC family transcriptional regulator
VSTACSQGRQETESAPYRAALIDFASRTLTPYVSYAARLPLGSVTLSRCIFPPNPGVTLGSTQVIAAVHTDASFELEWRDPDCDRLQRTTIQSGAIDVACADLPVFHRWHTPVKALVIALDSRFVAHTFADAFEHDAPELRTVIGGIDPIVQRLAALCDQEIGEGGAAGRLYTEGLATALVVHLFRNYASAPLRPRPNKGGLTASQLRRVVDYVEACVGDDIGLADLASLTRLCTHHFGQAFKTSMGVSPHRYLVGRRLHRAKELLLGDEMTIAEIAAAVGFSSQSHMTFNFRKLTGTTPARYRRDITGKAAIADALSLARATNRQR